MNTGVKIMVGLLGGVALVSGGIGVTDQAINPYVDTGTQYELRVGSDKSASDTVFIDKESPTITLDQWNGESQISFTAQFAPSAGASDAKATRPLLSKEMQFVQGAETAFVEPGAAPHQFAIDFNLDTKPDTNIFSYTVAGADNVNFYFQPPLNEEHAGDKSLICTDMQCKDGDGNIMIERPEDVVGSYAVYSKTKKNHIEGQTDYGTGKLFQIYRPKVTDSAGNSTWAELRYTDGMLSVVVPPPFLDTATYPVKVDPTFGYTTIGSNIESAAGVALGQLLSAYTAVSGDAVTSISFASNFTSGASFDAAIYTMPSTVPVSRLASPVTVAVPNGDVVCTLHSTATISQSLSAATTYTAAVAMTTGTGQICFDSIGSAGVSVQGGASLGASWTETLTQNQSVTIYATYSNTAAAAVPPPKVLMPPQSGTVRLLNGTMRI